MSQILTKLDKLSGSECSVLFSGTKPIASSFPKDKLLYLKLGHLAFTLIFKQATKTNPDYDEAHIQIGHYRLMCYRVNDTSLFIALLPERSEIHKAQRVLRESRPLFTKMIAKLTQASDKLKPAN
jgi:hypothetical protein